MDEDKKKHLLEEVNVVLGIFQTIITLVCLIYTTFFK